jgi:hypothetical protein
MNTLICKSLSFAVKLFNSGINEKQCRLSCRFLATQSTGGFFELAIASSIYLATVEARIPTYD